MPATADDVQPPKCCRGKPPGASLFRLRVHGLVNCSHVDFLSSGQVSNGDLHALTKCLSLGLQSWRGLCGTLAGLQLAAAFYHGRGGARRDSRAVRSPAPPTAPSTSSYRWRCAAGTAVRGRGVRRTIGLAGEASGTGQPVARPRASPESWGEGEAEQAVRTPGSRSAMSAWRQLYPPSSDSSTRMIRCPAPAARGKASPVKGCCQRTRLRGCQHAGRPQGSSSGRNSCRACRARP